MSFESLPNELLLHIFQFLPCHYLLHAFIDLNSRLDTLLLVHIQECSLNFQSVFKHDFDTICRQYLPSIIDRVIQLRLSNYKETPEQIQLFHSYNLRLRQFSNLRTLSLSNLSSDETMIEMILECRHIPNLTYLQIINFTFRSTQKRFQCFIDGIWNLPKLIYCKLYADLPYGVYSIKPTVISTSIKQLSLSGIQFCLNPINYVFDNTPHLQHFCSSITLRPNDQYSSYAVLPITKLVLSFTSGCTPSRISEFFQVMSNLNQLTVKVQYTVMDGYIWQGIIRNHLSKLKKFQLLMEIQIDDMVNKEERVDELVDSFRTQFWLEEHHWFVRCDWIPDRPYSSIFLYTLPYAFNTFHFNVPVLFKSTSPRNNDEHYTFDGVHTLHCDQNLRGELSLSHVYFRNIRSLSVRLPMNDQWWLIVPNFDKLISLNVLLDDNNALGQSQLYSLLDRAPCLRSLKIKSCSSSTQQVLFSAKHKNLSTLQLFSYGYSQCFYKQDCIALTTSSLGRQCEVLEIAVNHRTNIITLIQGMPKLRALYVNCHDDRSVLQLEVTNDELIEWLQQRLPSTSTCSRDTHLNYMIKIWIR